MTILPGANDCILGSIGLSSASGVKWGSIEDEHGTAASVGNRARRHRGEAGKFRPMRSSEASHPGSGIEKPSLVGNLISASGGSYPGPLAYRRSLITIDCSREGPTPMPEIGALQSSSIRFT